MNRAEKKGFIRKIILFVLILFYFLFGNSRFVIRQTERLQGIEELSSWNYVNKNEQQRQIQVPTKIFVKPNQRMTLTKKVTKKMSKLTENQAIGFYTVCTQVQVTLNGTSVYEHNPKPSILTGWAAASTFNVVKIPNMKEGDTIRIHLSSPYAMTSGSIPRILYGEDDHLIRYTYAKNMQYFFLDSIILFLGIFWVIHNLRAQRSEIFHGSGYALGILAITLSAWFFFGSEYRPSILISDAMTCYLAESAFLLLPVAYAMVLKELTYGKLQKMIQWTLDICIGNFFVSELLHILRICDMMETIFSIHILIVVLLVFTFIYYGRRLEQGALKWSSMEVLGGSILLISSLVELFQTYFSSLAQSGIAIRVGVIVYVLTIELQMMQEEKEVEHAYLENENRIKEIRLKMLSSQIQPHFIYNTLGSIQGLIRMNPEEASNLTYMFSKYLRENVNFMDSSMEIEFSQELNHIQNYVNIEQVRFGERVKVIYDIKETDFMVPALSIQPLIENAIKHGICKKDEGGTVILSVRKHGDLIRITIEDDGVGFDMKEVFEGEKPSVGLRNSIYRWEEFNQAKVRVNSKPQEGTMIIITFHTADVR